MTEAVRERVFIALWPSPEDAARMMPWVQAAQARCGGRPMVPDTLHLTLAFLGGVPAETLAELCRRLPQWPAQVGELELACFGRFEGPRIVWAGLRDGGPPWLHQLYQGLWQRLEPMGFRPDHAVFRPHVSLLRRAGPQDIDALHMPALRWRPAACRLVASRSSEHASRYRTLADMPLVQAG